MNDMMKEFINWPSQEECIQLMTETGAMCNKHIFIYQHNTFEIKITEILQYYIVQAIIYCQYLFYFLFIYLINYTTLDAKRRKYASALPSTFTTTRSPDNARKPQIWPISAKGSP